MELVSINDVLKTVKIFVYFSFFESIEFKDCCHTYGIINMYANKFMEVYFPL